MSIALSIGVSNSKGFGSLSKEKDRLSGYLYIHPADMHWLLQALGFHKEFRLHIQAKEFYYNSTLIDYVAFGRYFHLDDEF